MKKIVLLLGALLTAGSAMGCGQDDPAGDSTTAPEGGAVVSGSTASLELGVHRWRVNGEGAAIGLDADGARVAEFRLDGKAGLVRSVFPEGGTAAIDGSRDGLSSRSRALYRALLEDVRVQAEGAVRSDAEGDGLAVDKAIYSCYTWYNDCDVQGFYGILNGWWTGYICEISNNTRPYCGNYWALLY